MEPLAVFKYFWCHLKTKSRRSAGRCKSLLLSLKEKIHSLVCCGHFLAVVWIALHSKVFTKHYQLQDQARERDSQMDLASVAQMKFYLSFDSLCTQSGLNVDFHLCDNTLRDVSNVLFTPLYKQEEIKYHLMWSVWATAPQITFSIIIMWLNPHLLLLLSQSFFCFVFCGGVNKKNIFGKCFSLHVAGSSLPYKQRTHVDHTH